MYELILSDEALGELASIEPVGDRRRAVAALQRLMIDPGTTGFGTAVDASGRLNQVGVVGVVAFVYWTDHALRRVRVLTLRSMAE